MSRNNKTINRYPPQLIETAFTIWEAIDSLSSILWNTFNEEFTEFEEHKTLQKETRKMDTLDDLPF